jgi:acyl-CoA thioesterase I
MGQGRRGAGRIWSLASRLFVAALWAVAPRTAMAAPNNPGFPALATYRDADQALRAAPADPRRVVFMGDSITEFWDKPHKQLFANPAYVNRGISGQTTPQMLLRFRQDVIELKPAAVVILAGTNDVAGNTGPASVEEICGNLASMAELARAHGVKVVLATLAPAAAYPWAKEVQPIGKIGAINTWIRDYAVQNGLTLVDYFAVMNDGQGGLRPELSGDGVHPNAAGYAIMQQALGASLASLGL